MLHSVPLFCWRNCFPRPDHNACVNSSILSPSWFVSLCPKPPCHLSYPVLPLPICPFRSAPIKILSFSENYLISSSNSSQNSSFSSSVHPTWGAYADTMFMLIVSINSFAVISLSEILFTSNMLSLHFSTTTIATTCFFYLPCLCPFNFVSCNVQYRSFV